MADQYSPASPAPETRGWAGSLPAGNHWIFKRATRYCPQCLAGDGSAIQNDLGGPWCKTWRLPVVFACLKHSRFLAHLCPGCGRPAHDYATARGATKMYTIPLIPQANCSDLRPTQCRLPLANGDRSRRNSPTCGAELGGHPLDPGTVLADPGAIGLQKHINYLLDPSTPSDIVSCGLPTAGRQYFIDLRLITHLIRASWPRAQDLLEIPEAASAAISQDHHHGQQQHRDGRGIRRTMYDVPPLDAKTSAALLLTAHRLLQCRHPRLLTEQVRHLLGYDQRPPPKPPGLARSWSANPTAHPVCVTHWHPSSRPTRQHPPDAPVCPCEPRSVKPATSLNTSPDSCRKTGISATSLACAESIPCTCAGPRRSTCARSPWAAPSPMLPSCWESQSPGPRGAAGSCAAGPATAPSHSSSRPRCSTSPTNSTQLPHLINYQCRREALTSWSIDPSTWQQLTRQLGPNAAHTAKDLGDQARQAATISVWARVTQGDHPLAWRRRFDSSWISSQPGRLAHNDAQLQGILDQYADELAARIDRGEFS